MEQFFNELKKIAEEIEEKERLFEEYRERKAVSVQDIHACIDKLRTAVGEADRLKTGIRHLHENVLSMKENDAGFLTKACHFNEWASGEMKTIEVYLQQYGFHPSGDSPVSTCHADEETNLVKCDDKENELTGENEEIPSCPPVMPIVSSLVESESITLKQSGAPELPDVLKDNFQNKTPERPTETPRPKTPECLRTPMPACLATPNLLSGRIGMIGALTEEEYRRLPEEMQRRFSLSFFNETVDAINCHFQKQTRDDRHINEQDLLPVLKLSFPEVNCLLLLLCAQFSRLTRFRDDDDNFFYTPLDSS